jgi:FtsH-binding integral membrane protein
MDNYNSEPRVVNTDARALNAHFRKIYLYMALALLVTAVTAFVGATMFAQQVVVIFSSGISQLILMGVLFGFVWMFSRRVYENPGQAFGMLMGYAVLNGVVFAVYGIMYDFSLIASAFFTTAFLFAGMAFYGFTTKKSMASMGSILFGAVIALIIGSVINLFFFNSVVYLAISVIGVVVFALLTAYDMNRLKAEYMQYGGQGNATLEQGLAVSGALSLYMDFINLFLYILRLFTAFGSSND